MTMTIGDRVILEDLADAARKRGLTRDEERALRLLLKRRRGTTPKSVQRIMDENKRLWDRVDELELRLGFETSLALTASSG